MYGTWQLTNDGIELTWAVNHLAPFLLSKLLLDRLKESAPARIITTASQAHQRAHIPFDDLNAERSYRGFGRYCETKLANVRSDCKFHGIDLCFSGAGGGDSTSRAAATAGKLDYRLCIGDVAQPSSITINPPLKDR
jgi:hypothetical protein